MASDDYFGTIPRLFLDDESGRVVGSAGFRFAPKERRVEIGYGVSAAFHCHGYATEGVTLLTDEAFASGLADEVDAITAQSNLPSRRVLEKAGFINYGPGEDADGPIFLWKKERAERAPELTALAVSPAAASSAGLTEPRAAPAASDTGAAHL